MRHKTTLKILDAKLIMIIRDSNPDNIAPIVECMVKAGVRVLEITSNTPNYEQLINEMRLRYPQILIGAGTVTNVDIAIKSVNAGAQFLVTPNTDSSIVVYAHSVGIPVIMGAFTPTDIVQATTFNADIVKLFPAGTLGSAYLKSLVQGPFNDVVFFPVGGIDDVNYLEWINCGAKGVGIGGSLCQAVKNLDEMDALVKRVSLIVQQLDSI